MEDPPVYNPLRDGNIFEWILRTAKERRELLEKFIVRTKYTPPRGRIM